MRIVDFTEVLSTFLSFSRGGSHSAADLGADVPDPEEGAGGGFFFSFFIKHYSTQWIL